MPLYTSNSKNTDPNGQSRGRSYVQPIASTLAMFAVLLACLEGATRFGFTRISRIESRIHNEYVHVHVVRPGTLARPTILLLGNSLLLDGVDYDSLRRTLAPRATAVRFVIESTAYLDWYYGIRRLLAEGARPDRIVLCLNVSQLLSSSIRGEYSAFYLIRTQDIAEAGRAAGFDLTNLSGLFLGRYSLFYAGKSNLRNFVLNAVDRSYADVLHDFVTKPGPEFGYSQVLIQAVSRLDTLRELCAQYNVRFDFLLPPGFGDSEAGLVEAGKQAGASKIVLVPVPENSWGPDKYSDGFHLNQEGGRGVHHDTCRRFSSAQALG